MMSDRPPLDPNTERYDRVLKEGICMQKQYICNDDDLGCLHDYLVAAIAGDDLSELPRLWNQEIGVIHSHPHNPDSPRPPCEECIYQAKAAEHNELAERECAINNCLRKDWIQRHDATIAAQERERMLNLLGNWAVMRESQLTLELNISKEKAPVILVSWLLGQIESLRKGAP